MAQERGRLRGRLAGRYGLACGIMAALAACALLVGATLLGGLGGAPVTIERAPQVAAAGPAEDDEPKEDAEPEERDEVEEEPITEAAAVVVHVDGAVAAPGVYVLPEGSRANDAVAAAGGIVEGADTSGVNLAAPVSDGEKIHVPLEGEAAAMTSAPSGEGAADGPVNINLAGIDELDELPGVGEATARAIVEDREKNGPFSTPEDLMRVSGIGEKKFERLAGLICV